MEDIETLTERRNRNVFGGLLLLVATVMLAASLLLSDHVNSFLRLVGPVAVIGNAIGIVICWRRASMADSALLRTATSDSRPTSEPRRKAVEDRLDELERLKRRDMVSPEEYATKRQEILKDL
jgi:hypothetical protein